MPSRKKRLRAPRGTGSVLYSKRRKCWVARKPVGRKGGRTQYVERSGATQEEAIRRRDEALPPPKSVPLCDWWARWIASAELKPQSRDSYEEAWRKRIGPRLGHRPVAALTAYDVEEAVRAWGKAVGAGTVRRTLAALSSCLQAAVRAELVGRNVARAVKRPEAPDARFDLFTRRELERIIDAGLTRPNWRCFSLCAATGCRIGEALALKPGDYDRDSGRLSISRTRTRRHAFGTPKSKVSVRTILVPARARPALEKGVPNSHYSNVHVRWGALLRTLGLRYRTIHQLKHSVASLLAARPGMSLADAAAYCGDTLEVFVRTYVHPVGQDPGEALDELFGGPQAGP